MAEQPESVQAYIATFPVEAQPVLAGIRAAILAAAPGATETISYGMPTVALDGRRLIYFAGWKRHVALYAIGRQHAELETELAPFRAEKDTVRFPLNRPVPYDLVERLTRALIAARSA
ncbi:DUF1801 domain-containing protein [Cryobacterium lactosi]|uniref:DUF1801 domain-containing protein n=1 Tax=Cryobacterium lactosi TaxID=1259202 RepID=A0A4V3IY10_9MICO|nr:DUF1801 domain-containing protein [Cryobacterium lactosi]TFD94845.1 DUF1801 domain-containing protein [Cryobacterium lactosi]